MRKLFCSTLFFLSALLFCSATESFAQTEQTSQPKTMSINDVEEKPVFQEIVVVESDFAKWLYKNLQYPEIARENGIQGRVTVKFTIDQEGNVKDVKVLRGVEASLDKEAVRVISSSPKWKPARHNGEPVAVTYVFPVVFKLQ